MTKHSDLILKLKNCPLRTKMKDAIRAFLDAHPETSFAEVNVTYWDDNRDHMISGTVHSTELERKMDEVRAELKHNAGLTTT